LKDGKLGKSEKNSVTLRYYLNGKYIVRGLGISCTKGDWGQDEQRVRRTSPEYKKYNNRLEFIRTEIEKLEYKEIQVTADGIDKIIEAGKQGVELQQLVDKSELLTIIFSEKIDWMGKEGSYSDGTVRIYISTLNTLLEYEKEFNTKINLETLKTDVDGFVNKYVQLRRSKGNGDVVIKTRLKKINAVINWYNRFNKSTIPTITIKDTKWTKIEKDIVFLEKNEVKQLFNHLPKLEDKKYLVGYLFRCFSGMRLQDMNSGNINTDTLNSTTKVFKYWMRKTTKMVSVPLLGGNILYQLAEMIDFNFPMFEMENEAQMYATNEKEAIQKLYKEVVGGNRCIRIGKDLVEVAGLITSHSARRTFARLLYNIDKDIYLTSKVLGHGSISVTEIYLGLRLEETEDMYSNFRFDFKKFDI
jgi:integrase